MTTPPATRSRRGDLSPDEAEALTSKIREALRATVADIITAFQGRAWIGMEYDSWDDYVMSEFGSSPLLVPRADRTATVQELREAGMSMRAIATATGASKSTVGNDLAAEPVQNRTPVTGLDGKTYSDTQTRHSKVECPNCKTMVAPSNLYENGECTLCNVPQAAPPVGEYLDPDEILVEGDACVVAEVLVRADMQENIDAIVEAGSRFLGRTPDPTPAEQEKLRTALNGILRALEL